MKSIALASAIVACCALTNGHALASDWPSFRGPAGTGVVHNTTIPSTWSDKENVLWRVTLPDRGNSTPAVLGGRVFVTQAIEKENRRMVICFDANNGAQLWESGITFKMKEPTNLRNPYCAASPATDGERVVAFFGSAGLYCYDLAGSELWHRDLGDVDSWHGSGSSPTIHNGICYLNFGPGTQSALIACDVKTGDEIWRHEPPKDERGPRFGFPGGRRPGRAGGETGPRRERPRNEPSGETAGEGAEIDRPTPFENAGRSGDFSGKGGFNGSWSTPVVIQVGDREELVMVESTRIVAYDPKTGNELWKCNGLPPQVFASPAIGENVIVAMGHAMPNGTQVMAVMLGGSGDISQTHKLWEVSLKKECIASGIISNGCVFLVTDAGFGTCLDLATGEKKWEKRIHGKSATGGVWASLVQIDDHLLVTNLASEVFVLAASPEYKLLNSNYVGNETMCATPAVAGDRLFLRTYDALWCIGTKDNAE